MSDSKRKKGESDSEGFERLESTQDPPGQGIKPDSSLDDKTESDRNASDFTDDDQTISAGAKTISEGLEQTFQELSETGSKDSTHKLEDKAKPERSTPAANSDEDSVEPLTFMPPTFQDLDGGTLEATQQSDPEEKTQAEDPAKEKEYPDRIGRYRTLQVLGEGAFGIVLKCTDSQLDREVAIKLAKFHAMGSELAVQRFMGEARSAAQLRHPNIVPVFEYGKFESHHYIAYQFVEGRTLQQVYKKGLSVHEAIELMVPICRGLDYAHEQGIIHRDIKPANILIDKAGVPHIADFGCAREEKSDETRTVDGSLLGTPAYMSPEAAAGKANQADARSDIWSLGIMLYELLAKRRPFKGGIGKILADIQTSEPPSLRSKDPTLPLDLEIIVSKCLQKNPSDRFQTGGQLADELQRWLENRPIQSRRISLIRRSWMWSRRNPRWAAMWGALASMVLIVLLVTVPLLIQIRNKQQRLVQSHLDSLLTANPASVPVIIDDLKTLDRSVASQLENKLEAGGLSRSQEIRLRLAIRLLNENQRPFKADASKMLGLEPDELEMVIRVLKGESNLPFVDRFWAIAISTSESEQDSLRAACCLAQLDPQSDNWKKISLRLIGDLLDATPQNLAVWLRMLRPIAPDLKDDLKKIHQQAQQPETRVRAAQMLASLFSEDPEFLIQLAMTANPVQLRELARPLIDGSEDAIPLVENQLTVRSRNVDAQDAEQTTALANLLILAASLGKVEPFFDAMLQRDDPTLRTELIHRAPIAGLPVSLVRSRLSEEHWKRPETLMASLQMLGEYGEQAVYLTRRNQIKDQVLQIFERHPDVGVHSSAQWLLNRWGFGKELLEAKIRVQSRWPRKGYSWHEAPDGICFAVFGPIESFEMGQPGNKDSDFVAGFFHKRKIPRRFGISTTEVTVGQFLAIEKNLRKKMEDHLDSVTDEEEKKIWTRRIAQFDRNVKLHNEFESENQPVLNISWKEAAIFCALLDQHQGHDPSQSAYEIRFPKTRGEAFVHYEDSVLSNAGYRLPTSGEYEYSARAGALTRYHFGRTHSQMANYSWTAENSGGNANPVAQLKPNHFGLFDIHGNVQEWCHDPGINFPTDVEKWVDGVIADNDSTFPEVREIRDHYFASEPNRIGVYLRERRSQQTFLRWVGFRIAQTYPDREQ